MLVRFDEPNRGDVIMAWLVLIAAAAFGVLVGLEG